MNPPQTAPLATSRDVLATYEPSADTVRLAASEPLPAKLVVVLVQQGFGEDAVEFIARWLPSRSAIWWACMALWDVYRPEPPAAVNTALAAIVHWVEDPTEENRQAAEAGGKALGAKHPVGALSLATFWTSGSMSAADLPAVPPPPGLTAQVAAAALKLAIHTQGASRRTELLRHFAQLGLEVGAQTAHWELVEASP